MNLTQTAIFARRSILGFIIFSVLGLISFTGYKIWYANYLASLPPVEEIPDTKFGILPSPDFPLTKVYSANFTYSVDTTTGGLPTFEKLIKVYFLPKPVATFLDAEKGQALAEQFNIRTTPQILSETRYRYTEDNRSLTVELDSGNFIYQSGATPSGQKLSDDDQELIVNFKNFLSKIGIFKEELTSNRSKMNLLKYQEDKFIPAESYSDAQAAQIFLWPQDIDKKQIITTNFNNSLVSAIVVNSANQIENYNSLNFTYWPVDTLTFATYPLKSTSTAFEQLKSGQGIVVIEPLQPQVSITSVYLAYYQGENYSPYLQPIYVFEGPGFAAYIGAIEDSFNPAR